MPNSFYNTNSCNLNSLYNCTNTAPGIEEIIVFRFGDIYDLEYDLTLGNIINYKYRRLGTSIQVSKNTSFSESLIKTNNYIWEQNLFTSISKLEYEKRNEIFKLAKGQYTIIFKDSNGKSWLLGYDYPATIKENSNQTGNYSGSNHYEFTFSTANNFPIKEIANYDSECAVAFNTTILITSTILLYNNLWVAGTVLSLQNNDIFRTITLTRDIDFSLWDNDPIQKENDLSLLSALLGSDSFFSNAYFDNDDYEGEIVIESNLITYSSIIIDGSISDNLINTTLRIETNLNNSLPNINIEFSDSNGLVFSEPYNTDLTGLYQSIRGNSNDFYVDLTALYNSTDQLFSVQVSSDSIICSTLIFEYEYINYANCGLAYEYRVYNSTHYSITVDKFTDGLTYRKFKLKIGDFISYEQELTSSWHSNFNTLVALFDNIFLNNNTGVTSYNLYEKPKTWTLNFTHDNTDLDCFIIQYGIDIPILDSFPDIQYKVYPMKQKVGLNLKTITDSSSNLNITNLSNSETASGIQSNPPLYSSFETLEVPFDNTAVITGNLGINITEWQENDDISITANSLNCPNLMETIKIETCLDAALLTKEFVITDYIFYSNDNAAPYDLGSEIAILLSNGQSHTINIGANINFTNINLLSAALSTVSDITIFDWSYDEITNTYLIRFQGTDIEYINTISFTNPTTTSTIVIRNGVNNIKSIEKQHPDIDISLTYTNLFYSSNILSGKVKEYHIDNKANFGSTPYLEIEFDGNDGLNLITKNSSSNNFTSRVINFYSKIGTNLILEYTYTIPNNDNVFLSNLSTIIPNYNNIRVLEVVTATTANYFLQITGNISTDYQIYTYGSHNYIISYGKLDNYKILYNNAATYPSLDYNRTSILCPNGDIDALNYIYLSDIQLASEEDEIYDLVNNIKTADLWNKVKALYPLLGSSLTNKGYNIKDNRFFNLSFNGGWDNQQVSVTALSNSSYIDTFINHQRNFTNNNIFALIRNQGNSYNLNSYDFGIRDSNTSNGIFIAARGANTSQMITKHNSTTNQIVSNTNAAGTFYINRTNANDYLVYRNGTTFTQTVTASTTRVDGNIFIGALNNYVSSTNTSFPTNPSRRAISLFCIGQDLTTVEAASLNNILTIFITNLNK